MWAKWRRLHARHTPIRVHILIKANIPNKVFTCAARLREYSCWHANQQILNKKPEVKASWCRWAAALFCFFSSKNTRHLQGMEHTCLFFGVFFFYFHVVLNCFFGSSTSQFDDNSCSPSHAQPWKKKTTEGNVIRLATHASNGGKSWNRTPKTPVGTLIALNMFEYDRSTS